MIYYLLLLIVSSSSTGECDWDYGIPGEHNKHTDDDVRRSLIVDGEATHPHEYPWQVAIEPIGCGGSIISREYILTAAHCVFPGTPTVVAGLNRYRITGTWIQHEEYDDNNILNDIAVIRLDEPLPCDDPTVNAIALPELVNGFSLDDCSAWVTGFGALQEGGFSPSGYQMHEVQTKVWSTDTCNRSPENVFLLPQTQICGFTQGKPTEDSCQGDSGGPFKIDINADSKAYHKYVQVGVVSYGAGCGRTAGIYTDVSEYKDWILGKVPTAHFEQVSTCDRESYHEGIVDCEGRDCRLEVPYCAGDSSIWRAENGRTCNSYSNNQLNCFADKGDNLLFASQVCPQCGYCQTGQESTQLSLTNEIDCSDGSIPVDIEITTDVWAKEISFSIGETCSGSGFQNHANYTSTCCLSEGEQVVNCRDAYGDGWHGAQLLVDGELKCGEFEAELQVESFFVRTDESAAASEGGAAGAIAAGVLVPIFLIALLCACWFYIWPQFGDKAMEACEDCFATQGKSFDPESQRAPLSPEVTKSEFSYPAPIAPSAAGPRRSSYWNNFHAGPSPSINALPQAPSIGSRANTFRKASPPPPKEIFLTWHFTGPGGSDVGPVSDEEFKSKIGSEVGEETYVWNGETVNDWTYAKDVPALKSLFAAQKVTKQSAPSPMEWYYVDATGKDVGPVTDKIFKTKLGKQIVAEALVWNGKTVTDWTAAKDVPELKNLVKPLAPARRNPPKSRFVGRNTPTAFARPVVAKKAAFATKRQASSKQGGVSDLISRFNQ